MDINNMDGEKQIMNGGGKQQNGAMGQGIPEDISSKEDFDEIIKRLHDNLNGLTEQFGHPQIVEVESSELLKADIEGIFEEVPELTGVKQDIEDISETVNGLKEIKQNIEGIFKGVHELKKAAKDIKGISSEMDEVREVKQDVNRIFKGMDEIGEVKQDIDRIFKELHELKMDLRYCMEQTRHWRGKGPKHRK